MVSLEFPKDLFRLEVHLFTNGKLLSMAHTGTMLTSPDNLKMDYLVRFILHLRKERPRHSIRSQIQSKIFANWR